MIKPESNKNQLDKVKQLGCELTEEEINSIKVNFSNPDLDIAKNFILKNFSDKNKKLTTFHPGAGKTANIWHQKNFIKLIKKLNIDFNINVLITSGWIDDKIILEISKELNQLNIKHTVLHNAPVKKLGAILSLVDLYITNGTGTMHIAGYSDAKMISLFGPTNPNEWAPKGINQKHIKSNDENINSISVDEVYQLAKFFLTDN